MTEYAYTMLTKEEQISLLGLMSNLAIELRYLDCMSPDVYYDLFKSDEFNELHSILTGKLNYIGELKKAYP